MPQKQLPPALARAAEEGIRQRIRDDCHGKSEDVARRLTVIEKNFGDLGFDSLKQIGPLADDTLYRFRAELGRDPKTYCDDLRAALARDLVCKSDADLCFIAKYLGFTDTEHFSKWFKRRHGKSPTQLRTEQSTVPPTARPAGRITAARKQDLAIRGWRRAFVGASALEEAVRLQRQIHGKQVSAHPTADLTTDSTRGGLT